MLTAEGRNPQQQQEEELQVERKTGKVRRPETDVKRSTTVPRHQLII